MSVTLDLLQLDPDKYIYEHAPNETSFGDKSLQYLQKPNGPTGISCEEAELLYGLVRITRPKFVLETGCNIGVSASVIGLALAHNDYGSLMTVEHDQTVVGIARTKLATMGFDNITVVHSDISNVHITQEIDFLFLDTELALRFAELLRFYPLLRPGGIACIHDLPTLNHPEFGGVPSDLQNLLRKGDLRAMTFPTAHGITVFQKRFMHDGLADLTNYMNP